MLPLLMLMYWWLEAGMQVSSSFKLYHFTAGDMQCVHPNPKQAQPRKACFQTFPGRSITLPHQLPSLCANGALR